MTPDSSYYHQTPPPGPPQDYGYQNTQGYATNDYETDFYTPPDGNLMHESVQDRVDKWRTDQMAKRDNQTPEQQQNIRDEQGRMKLLATVGRASRVFIFFLLMWRDIHLFEMADNALKGFLRTLIVGPLTVLFMANLAGVIISFTSSLSHAGKKRLKAILNLDKVVEIVLLSWNMIRLTVIPSKLVPREIYVASMIHNIFFLIQCQAFTRVNWDEKYLPTDAKQQQQQQNPYSQQTAGKQYYYQGSNVY